MPDTVSISVDIGGTFTDVVVMRNFKIEKVFKVPTTPRNPEIGALNGIETEKLTGLNEFVHATTIATNSLLGQYGLKLPKIALITTKGFKDIIEIGRQNRPSLYDLNFVRPKVLVSRNMRFEIDERTNVDGEIIKPVDQVSAKKIADLMEKKKPEAVAISFLHSYVNDNNEKQILELFKDRFRYISLSSEVAPEPREYERTATTVVNSALAPVLSEYLRKLETSLYGKYNPTMSVMSSSGGLVSFSEAKSKPVSIIESGPAAGVIAANEFARQIKISNILSFDMGGTTAKAGTVLGNNVEITSEYEVGGTSHHGRTVKGSGYPIRFPFVDLAEVSAGGGTIIWKDKSGAINIGPMSAGSDPGPVSYDMGGREPTITDANLILGIINEKMSGSDFKLRRDLAREAMSKLGEPFEVASRALKLADLEMARAIRLVTVERGLDPESFVLMGFGGAGPQHAARLASEVNIKRVIIPPNPGVFSALGLLFSDWKYEARKAYPKNVEGDFEELKSILLERHGNAEFSMYADCRYVGQGSELTVQVTVPDQRVIESDFEKLHFKAYGFNLRREIEIFAIRVFAVLNRKKPDWSFIEKSQKTFGRRNIMIDNKWKEVDVYPRPALSPGDEIPGPAAVDEEGSTTYIPSNWKAKVGPFGEIDMEAI